VGISKIGRSEQKFYKKSQKNRIFTILDNARKEDAYLRSSRHKVELFACRQLQSLTFIYLGSTSSSGDPVQPSGS